MGTAPAAAGGDRLSNLPDCLLHSVLSHLRSRQVVHTGLLSRRWRHLWRAVPCVDIHHRDFLDEPEPEPEPEAFYRADGAFDAAMYDAHRQAQDKRMGREIMQRQDSVLPLNAASPLDAYRLHLGGDVHLRKGMGRWIRRALARRPAELRVACDYDHGNGYHRSSKDPFFSLGIFSRTAGVTSRLRRLSLSGLILFELFEEELRSECPVLEDLQLVNCECHRQSPGRLRITSRSLKRLAIVSSSSEARLCLTAPALVSLNVGMPVAVEEEMPSLAVASISCHAGVLSLLKSLRTARALELQRFTTCALVGEEPELFREFHNLRTLVLTECEIGDGCQVLAHALKSFPNLERIVLQDCMVMYLLPRVSLMCRQFTAIELWFNNLLPSSHYINNLLPSSHYINDYRSRGVV
ncbi:MEIOTIC F-BOX protein MOF-like [Triticum dicoccoides]|uniref:MEIOTIC F-BOX protein MOF-like n=1 Tax=Triticum dicoccoides TaxID=85692 RepID=UPI001890E388|nr:MEIOTIC F-BOX protein MOF-like [Triticum dicoccoides]